MACMTAMHIVTYYWINFFSVDSCLPNKDLETVISELCYAVGGIHSVSVSSTGGILSLGSAKLLVPSGAIPQGKALHVSYAFLMDGTFSIPEVYGIVSTVLYTSTTIHPWWRSQFCSTSTTGMLEGSTAQHGFPQGPLYSRQERRCSFCQHPNKSFSGNKQFAVLELKEDLCCVTVAVEKLAIFSVHVIVDFIYWRRYTLAMLCPFVCTSLLMTIYTWSKVCYSSYYWASHWRMCVVIYPI